MSEPDNSIITSTCTHLLDLPADTGKWNQGFLVLVDLSLTTTKAANIQKEGKNMFSFVCFGCVWGKASK